MRLFLSGNPTLHGFTRHLNTCRKTVKHSQINSKGFTAVCNITVPPHSHQWIYFQPSIAWQWWCNSAAASGSRTNPSARTRKRCSEREAPVAPPLVKTKNRSQKCPVAQLRTALTGACDAFHMFIYIKKNPSSFSGSSDVSLRANWLAIDW